MPLETPLRPLPGPLRIVRDLSLTHAANGFVGFVFAASGPLAILLTAGTKGGLAEAEIASIIFAALFCNGLLSVLFCILYRQPLVFFWTIPGAVLVAPALAHASLPEVIGAFLVAGLAMTLLGATGLVGRVMGAIPLPIVMGMVAGVFLPFGLDWLRALAADPLTAGAMTAAFLAASALPSRFARMPPKIAALVVGVAMVWQRQGIGPMPSADLAGGLAGDLLGHLRIAKPVLMPPKLSIAPLVELVVPLLIMVLVVQNGQGAAVLRLAGHAAPINAVATGCGLMSMLIAPLGCVSTCLTGPVNAIISGSGRRDGQYTAGIVVGLLAIGFGLFAPTFTRAMLAAPPAFIATLAGLAMLRVLQTTFTAAFAGPYSLGALVALLVTVAGIAILNIGAPFWGLVCGVLASGVLERRDFQASRATAGTKAPTPAATGPYT